MLARFGIRSLLLAVAVVVAVVFAAVVGVASMREVRSLVIETSIARQELLARALAAEYEQFIRLHQSAIELVAHRAATRARLDTASLYPVLRGTNGLYDAFWGIGVTDHTGRIVAVDPPTRPDGSSALGIDLSDRAWFKELVATRRTVVDRRVLMGRVKPAPTITVNAPILDASGRVRGAVTGGLELDHVRQLAERTQLGATGHVSVASGDAVLFVAGRADLVNRDVSSLPFWPQMSGTSGRLESYRGVDGTERIAGFATVPNVGWKVWVSQETAEIERDVRAAHARLMGWVLAVLGVTLAGAVLVGVVLTRPIAAVESTAAAIAAGDLERRAAERGPREVVGLARSFNRMADALQETIAAERRTRLEVENALRHYGRFAARVAGGDLAARVDPAGGQEFAELGRNLNRMAAELERQLGELRETTEQLRDETAAIETVNRVSRLLSGELDMEKLVQALTDAATELTGAAFGACFYNVVGEGGESYTLHTLSGAPKEAFARFPMPRNTALFDPTFRGEAVVRLGDARKDPRYGKNAPHAGPPPGHLPVVSYLAVPVVSRTGEVFGGLFFGHPNAGVFTARHERIAVALAAQAAVAMDNARLYEREQRARAAAEAANRSKDEFLATLSHELRTPMNAILGWTVMLRSGQLEPGGHDRALAAVERNARMQSQLIEDLLDISRIVTGTVHLDVRPFDVKHAVEAAVDAVRPTAEGRRLTLAVDLESAPILGDPDRVQQIAWNLLANAIKFTPAGGRITVRLSRTDDVAVLVVADDGQGISADVLPHVFERFRQADSTTTRRHGGLGLGLALVRDLVERHGGSVEAHSDGIDTGSSFTVRLPIAPVVTTPADPPATPRDPLDPGLLAGVRVLLVDDDGDALDVFTRALTLAGATVRTARSTAEALEVFSRWRPDVIASDIAMPGDDGYALLQKIRAFPPAEGGLVPAVALTAHGALDERIRALAAGFHSHVAKPVDPGELALTVARLAAPRGG